METGTDTEENQRRQLLRIGYDATNVNTLPNKLLTDEASHMFVTDPCDQALISG